MQRLPATRAYLQKLTQRIERIERSCIISHVPSGTGIRAFQKDAAARLRRKQIVKELWTKYHLAKIGWLEIIQTGEEATMRLTQDGCITVVKDRVLTQNQQLSDGWVCVVVFDIPEDLKTLRKTFRRFLKQAGFIQLQLSVWTITKDVINDLTDLVKLLKIQRWVKIFVGMQH